MMDFRKLAAAAVISAPLMVLSQPAQAGEATTEMAVAATVVNNCTVIATPMNFGVITDFEAADIDTTSTLSLVCTPNAGYEVKLSDGVNAQNGQRRLVKVGGTEAINYDIYSNLGRTSRWGDTAGTDTVSGSVSLAGTATVTAYGRIAKGQAAVTAGEYADRVTVTVNF